ncbi:MAG TPA: multidrug effflux MFS transporter [Ohtaekwangia sp.]|nr:multidrug effflux MFS transporter [Ohtaekwangia sp.]
MTGKQHFIIVLVLGALSTISPFAIDMYLPGFPAIADDLNTSMSGVQLSLTAYLAGIAVGQLIYGPLLDRYGRKKPLYIGVVIYIAASIGCAFTGAIESLIAMRFLQAIGGCAGMVAAQTLVRDLFPVNKTAQAYSSLTLVIAVSPLIAPTVGGYVTVAFGWHAVFVILAGVGLILLGTVYLVLPEGRPADASISLRPKAVLKNFYGVIREPQFLIYTAAGGIATAAPFAFLAASSDVFINLYHVDEKIYGWIFATIAFAIIGSTQLNHFLLKRFKSEQVFRGTLVYQTVIGIVLVTGTTYHWFSMTGLIAMMFVFFSGQGLTGPNATALSLAPFTRHTGSAAALLGSFRMAIGGLVTASVSLFHNGTAVPMVTMMVLCSVTGLVILTIGRGTVRYKVRRKKVEEERSLIA